jgi:hypothetical protein
MGGRWGGIPGPRHRRLCGHRSTALETSPPGAASDERSPSRDSSDASPGPSAAHRTLASTDSRSARSRQASVPPRARSTLEPTQPQPRNELLRRELLLLWHLLPSHWFAPQEILSLNVVPFKGGRAGDPIVGWDGTSTSGLTSLPSWDRSISISGFAIRNTSETPLALAGTAWPPRPPTPFPRGLSWASEGADRQDASSTTISAPYKCRFMVVPLKVEVNCCRTTKINGSQPQEPWSITTMPASPLHRVVPLTCAIDP